MRRTRLVLAVAAVMVALLVATAAPAMAIGASGHLGPSGTPGPSGHLGPSGQVGSFNTGFFPFGFDNAVFFNNCDLNDDFFYDKDFCFNNDSDNGVVQFVG
jgi:hypothetical protein